MALVLAVTICACGAKEIETLPSEKNGTGTTAVSAGAGQDADTQEGTDPAADSAKSKSAEQPAQESASAENTAENSAEHGDDTEEDDEAALAAIGDVETKDGILTVSINVPSDLVGETTQEELDQSKGILYQSAVLNDDGSVTYKMTKLQHRAMLDKISEAVDESAQEMIDDEENYTIAAVTHNDDCTEFNVTLDGTEIGFGDYFTTYSFFLYGGMYGKFSGHIPEHMIVNFYDPDGNLIEAVDSADFEDSEGDEEEEF